MKTTFKTLFPVIAILFALFFDINLSAQVDSTREALLGPLPEASVLTAQNKFKKRYSTEEDIDLNNAVIPVNTLKEDWFDAQPTDSTNGLVLHYLIGDDKQSLKYLVGLGLIKDSEIIKYSPFPPSDNFELPYYYLIEAHPYRSAEKIAAIQQGETTYITQEMLNSEHQNYDTRMNRLNWFGVFNRDVINIRRHPNMIHYHFDSLKIFYEEFAYYQDCYLLEDTARTLENPELYLFISTGAYNGEKPLKRRFHTPILRFGSAYRAFEIDDNEYIGRPYKNKAFDVGVLCPPNCPSEIWPSN